MHFRIRTFMIAIAALAVTLGVFRLLALASGVMDVSVRFLGSNPCLVIEVASNESYESGPGGSIFFGLRSTYYIPLYLFAAVGATVVAIWAVIARVKGRRRQAMLPEADHTRESVPARPDSR